MKRGLAGFLLLITLFLALFILASSFVSAVVPVLFFSDLDSGPKTGGQNNKGAFVTIWGKNFGATQGTSYVSIGGGQADNYPVWTDTKISFQLGSNTATGNITVTTSEGTSNGMPFTVRSGNIYFVSTSGSNSNSGSYSSPWRTWQYAANTIQPGDTVYGRGGNYTTSTDLGTFSRCFSIGQYAYNSAGAAGMPKAFVAYPGEIPILYPVGMYANIIQIYDGEYVTISSLHLYDPSGEGDIGGFGTSWNSDGNTNNVGHIRFVGNVIKNSFLLEYNAMSGAVTACNGHDIYIAGNQVSNVGNHKQEHGIYLNEALTDVIVEYNEVFDVHNGYGIEVYNDYSDPYTNCVIRNNIVYRSGRAGIQISSTGNYKVYNNILWDNGQITFAGLNLRGGDSETTYEIYNNVLYDNGENELSDGNDNPYDEPYGQIFKDGTGIQSLIFRNNIIQSINNQEPYWRKDSSGGVQIFSNNLYYGNGGKPSFDNGVITLNSNPLFTNPTSDFHLQTTSSAINAGADVSSVVTRDFDGISRPQGSAFDIGAYEYLSSAPIHPADTNQNNIIEMKELIAFIGLWKVSQASINDVLSALDRWMRGN